MSNLQTWRVCVECGREFFGFNSSKFCPVCKTDRTKETPPELADEKEGWRHMFRDRTGTVIVPGGNVIHALDDLCAYEEACEAAGIRGPEELRKALLERQQATGNRQQVRGGQGSGRPTKDGGTGWYDPHAKRDRRTQGKHCEGCSHFHPTIASGARGICDKHPRRVRPQGGKDSRYVIIPDEPRQCQARRVACSDWEAKQTGGPGDPAPMRDGVADCHGKHGGQESGRPTPRNDKAGDGGADCHGKRGGQGSGRPTPRNDKAGDGGADCHGKRGGQGSGRPTPRNVSERDGGQGSGRPTGETPPEWVGPSAELKQKEGS